jgi:ribonuclease P protein component
MNRDHLPLCLPQRSRTTTPATAPTRSCGIAEPAGGLPATDGRQGHAGAVPAFDPGIVRQLESRAERGGSPVRIRMAGERPAVRVFDGPHRERMNEEPARTHEEDVSAQEARAEARAWLPSPDGHEGRTPRARSSSGQGAHEAQRLTAERATESMPVLPMLRRRADFEAIGRQGTARSTPILVLRALRTDRAETRIGLSTPRTLGGAVQRNRVRRRLRELVRTRMDGIGPGWDILLIARPAAGTATYAELGEAFDALVRRSDIGR